MARVDMFEWGHEFLLIAVGMGMVFRLYNPLSRSLGIRIRYVVVAI
jgi:hypothetical protein